MKFIQKIFLFIGKVILVITSLIISFTFVLVLKNNNFSANAIFAILMAIVFIYPAYFLVKLEIVYPIRLKKNNEKLSAALNKHRKILESHELTNELIEHDKMVKEWKANDKP